MTHPPPRRGFSRADVAVSVAVLVAAFGVLIPACSKAQKVVDGDMARDWSVNNLKQMCLGVQELASRTGGILPPSVGTFPGMNGPNSSIFFHILTDIEQDEVYITYRQDPTKVPETRNIKTYCAPLDQSNPGVNTNLCSYASNAQVFGLKDGGSVRFPTAFNAKGTSNTILFMERYAVVGAPGTRHTWNGRRDRENYLYPAAANVAAHEQIAAPQFGVAPSDASDETAHTFRGTILLVGLADGSVRKLRSDVVRPLIYDEWQVATVWAWACTLDGPLGKAKVPAGW
jgi:hypothetical protein